MANPVGTCAVCGEVRSLSFEHIPPKIAGNVPYGRELDISYYLKNDVGKPLSVMRGRNMPKGSGRNVLCERCNNQTGADYAEAYGDWAFQGLELRQALGDTNSLSLPFRILPSRVFKQILTMLAATSGPGLFEANQILRNLVLDPHARNMPESIRLYCYMVHRDSQYSRSSGVFGMWTGSEGHTMVEFAYQPFGYILTLDGKPPPDRALFDITFFSHHGFNEYRELHLPIPVRPVETYFPADFRTKKEWEAVTGGGFARGKRKD